MRMKGLAAVLIVVAVLVGFGTASAQTWHKLSRNHLVKGELEVQDGFYSADSAWVNGDFTMGDKATVKDTLTTDGDGVITKPGSFSANADSTVTLTGATTASSTFGVTGVTTLSDTLKATAPVSIDSLQNYAHCGEYTMTADTDSFAVVGLKETDRVITSFSTTPSADFTADCEAGQVKLSGTSANGSKVHYIIVRPKT